MILIVLDRKLIVVYGGNNISYWIDEYTDISTLDKLSSNG